MNAKQKRFMREQLGPGSRYLASTKNVLLAAVAKKVVLRVAFPPNSAANMDIWTERQRIASKTAAAVMPQMFGGASLDPMLKLHATEFHGLSTADLVTLSSLKRITSRVYRSLEDALVNVWRHGMHFVDTFDPKTILVNVRTEKVYILDYQGVQKIPKAVLKGLGRRRGPTVIAHWIHALGSGNRLSPDVQLLRMYLEKIDNTNYRRGIVSSRKRPLGRLLNRVTGSSGRRRAIFSGNRSGNNNNGGGPLPPLRFRKVIATEEKDFQPRVFPENSSWGFAASLGGVGGRGGGGGLFRRTRTSYPKNGNGTTTTTGIFANFNENGNENGNGNGNGNGNSNSERQLAQGAQQSPFFAKVQPHVDENPLGQAPNKNKNTKEEENKLPFNKSLRGLVAGIMDDEAKVDALIQKLLAKGWYVAFRDQQKLRENAGIDYDVTAVYGLVVAVVKSGPDKAKTWEAVSKFVDVFGNPQPEPWLYARVWRSFWATPTPTNLNNKNQVGNAKIMLRDIWKNEKFRVRSLENVQNRILR